MTHYVSGESTARTTAAIERPTVHFNSVYLWTISLVAALGGLLFGYDWVVIGGAKPFYEKYFHLTNASQQGWAVSCALIGCLFGAMISGTLCDKYGRKLLLLLSALLFAVSSLAIAMTECFSYICGLANRWRHCHWAGFESFSHVYRGDRARTGARQAGFGESAHDSDWNFVGPIHELDHRQTSAQRRVCARNSELMEWPDRMALDVWCNRCAFPAVFSRHAVGTREPTMACAERPAGESQAHPATPGW